MWESLASGTLQARQAVLESTVDCTIVEGNGAELYYEFPCAKLSKVPLAQFVMEGSTFKPVVVAFQRSRVLEVALFGVASSGFCHFELLRTGSFFF